MKRELLSYFAVLGGMAAATLFLCARPDVAPSDVVRPQQRAGGDRMGGDENGLAHGFRRRPGRAGADLAQPDDGQDESRQQREHAYSEQEVADKHCVSSLMK